MPCAKTVPQYCNCNCVIPVNTVPIHDCYRWGPRDHINRRIRDIPDSKRLTVRGIPETRGCLQDPYCFSGLFGNNQAPSPVFCFGYWDAAPGHEQSDNVNHIDI